MKDRTPLGVIAHWRCPVCAELFPLPAFWTHLEAAHGLPRHYTRRDLERVLVERLLTRIETADPRTESVPSGIRHAARDVRAVLSIRAHQGGGHE